MPNVKADGIPRIHSYADAHRVWDTTAPIRGSNDWSRPLGPRSKHEHINIRRGNNDQIHCRLYATDVVTYYPDGRIELKVWSSPSTNAVVGAILPRAIRAHYADAASTVTVDDRVWQLDRAPILAPTPGGWHLESGGTPWTWYTLNRKVANAAVKATPFRAFHVWAAAYRATRRPDDRAPRVHTYGPLHTYLSDRALWPSLADHTPESVIRWDILRATPGVVTRHTAEWIRPEQVAAVTRSYAKYRSLDRHG